MDAMRCSIGCRLVRAKTDDGLWLQGLRFDAVDGPLRPRGIGLLHIHGLAGNFYENDFIDREAEALAGLGVTMLSVSTRGRDYESDFIRESGGAKAEVRVGSARERMADSAIDIVGWINAMKASGISEIILQGHSLGTLKAAHYLSGCSDAAVRGAVLLSPADMFGIQREHLGSDGEWDRVLKLARDMVGHGEGDGYMPDGSFFAPTTASAYVDKYGDGTWDLFPIEDRLQRRNPSWATLGAIRVPCLVLYGDTNEAVVGNRVQEAVETLSGVLGSLGDCRMVAGADHSYRDAEDSMARAVCEWIGRIMGDGDGNR